MSSYSRMKDIWRINSCVIYPEWRAERDLSRACIRLADLLRVTAVWGSKEEGGTQYSGEGVLGARAAARSRMEVESHYHTGMQSFPWRLRKLPQNVATMLPTWIHRSLACLCSRTLVSITHPFLVKSILGSSAVQILMVPPLEGGALGHL